MTVGERMKLRRKELGMNAEAVAKILNVSPATIYRYESGDIEKMGVDKLAPLAKAINTTPEYLMGWEHAEKEPAADTSDKLPADFYLLSEEQQKQVTDYISFLLSQK